MFSFSDVAPKRVMRSKGPTPQRATPQREQESNSDGNIPSKAFKVLQQTINQSPAQSGRFFILLILVSLVLFCFFAWESFQCCSKHATLNLLFWIALDSWMVNPQTPILCHTPAFFIQTATNSKLIPSKYVYNTCIYIMHLCQSKMLSEFYGLPPQNFRFKSNTCRCYDINLDPPCCKT